MFDYILVYFCGKIFLDMNILFFLLIFWEYVVAKRKQDLNLEFL